MQSKRGSLIEAAANTAIGYLVAVAANVVVLPMFGMHPSVSQSFGIGAAFTVISLVRSYALRRFFNRSQQKAAQ
ncbi:MAG TPA: hypothetical protein VGD96_24225 [Bradyrhizobium sp.]